MSTVKQFQEEARAVFDAPGRRELADEAEIEGRIFTLRLISTNVENAQKSESPWDT